MPNLININGKIDNGKEITPMEGDTLFRIRGGRVYVMHYEGHGIGWSVTSDILSNWAIKKSFTWFGRLLIRLAINPRRDSR